MTFIEFCNENSRKLGRSFILVSCSIMMIFLYTYPFIKSLDTEALAMLIIAQNYWKTIYGFVVGFYLKGAITKP